MTSFEFFFQTKQFAAGFGFILAFISLQYKRPKPKSFFASYSSTCFLYLLFFSLIVNLTIVSIHQQFCYIAEVSFSGRKCNLPLNCFMSYRFSNRFERPFCDSSSHGQSSHLCVNEERRSLDIWRK